MIRLTALYSAVFSLLLSITAGAQNVTLNGRFNTYYYSVNDFGSSGQIWAGVQDADGNVYFGNRQDILMYNGVEWRKIKVDRKKVSPAIANKVTETKVRELFRGSDGIVYAGRENNFGYIAYSDSGVPAYYPLFSASEKETPGNFWGIYELSNQRILFVGENALYTSQKGKTKKLELPTELNGFVSRTSCRFGNGILIPFQKQVTGEGERRRQMRYLYVPLISGKPRIIQLPEYIDLRNIRGSFEINRSWYVQNISGTIYRARMNEGTIIWNKENETFFPDLQKFEPNYVQRHGNHLYLGTENNGLIIADLHGKIVRRFDFNEGLSNLYVFKFFHDREGNLWLCLDNGIQMIESSSPVTSFTKEDGITSLPEAIVFDGDQMLLGLHSDIFGSEIRDTRRKFLSKDVLHQDIFDLDIFYTSKGKRTLVIGYDGIYEYLGDSARIISPTYAFSLFQDPLNKDVVYVTLEAGIGKLVLGKNGRWEYRELWNNVGGETFNLTVAHNKIYFGISRLGLGIYDLATGKHRIVKESSIRKGVTSSYQVEYFRGDIFVETTLGLCTLSKDERSFRLLPGNDSFFGTTQNDFHRIVNINDEQLWLVVYRELGDGKFDILTGWLEPHGKNNWKWIQWPLANLKNAGIIYCIAQGPVDEIWLGANNGLYVVNFNAIRNYSGKLTVAIDRFEAGGKTLGYNVFHASRIESLTYKQNSFRVTFHAQSFSARDHMEYRTRLEGFSDDWSEWSNQYYKDFQKIPEGTYVLKIQARNGFGIESEVLAYEITILPPWYRTAWAYTLYIIALIILIYLIVQLSTKRVKRQNQRLETIVQERTSEIAEQNKQLEQQKEEITQKTTDILDSIQYAKRIQSTILPAESRLAELFEEHFVFYRPKDIVSGDFYWAREVHGKAIFAAVDCTGHGVPGSLVSIVGNNGLLRAVNEFRLTEPHEILDRLREIVVGAFRSEGQLDVKDGMDIALCSIDYETGILKYAGANNECVIIRGKEIFELKPDKQPIGQFVDDRPFTQKEFQLEDGDCIYLYTDGYVDQFGGEKIKKFKSRPFKTMLAGLTHLPMDQQLDAVQKAFDNWKGDIEQVDDVCVFAVRYKQRS